MRDILQRAVDPEIATSDHHRVRGLGDAGKVGESRGSFDLGHDPRSLPDDRPQFLDVGRSADERQGDVVGSRSGHCLGQLEILGGRGVQRQSLTCQMNPRAALGAAARLDLGDELVGRLADDAQRDLAVAENDSFADVDVREQVGIVDGDAISGAVVVAGDEM